MITQVCKFIASEYGRHRVRGSVLMAPTSGAFFLLEEFEKTTVLSYNKSFVDGSINLN